MTYVLFFFAGLFLCNSAPHLAAGLRGELFPSPFAKPPGIGASPPWVNVLWGWVNLAIGIVLARWGQGLGFSLPLFTMMIGALVGGLGLAHHFGNVRRASGG